MADLARYQLGKRLGAGAFGEVFAAHDPEGTPVAVKVITDAHSTLSLQREILAIAALDHPHIVRIFDFGTLADDTIGPTGTPFLVMERCSGGTLSQRAKRLGSFDEVRSILLKLLGALSTAHAHGLIHRDLKLSNVLYCNDEDLRPGLRLVDFGLAGDADAMDLGGTPLYMPPEQIEESSIHIGPWTDLFALGVLAWRLVAPQPWLARNREELFKRKTHEQFAPFEARIPVPAGFEEWIKTLLSARWEARFLSAAAASQALHELGEDLEDAPTLVAPSAAELPTELVSKRHVGRWSHAGGNRNTAPRAQTPIEPSAIPWTRSPPLTHAARALLVLREPPFVGRAHLRRTLWERFETSRRSGKGDTVALTGPEDVGRARLARWLAQQAHVDAGAWAVVLNALPRPFDLIARVLRVRRALVSEVKTRLERLGVASEPALQALEALELSPDQGWVSHSLALRILGALARVEPVILVCLDVDGDPDLARLAKTAIELKEPLFVVTTAVHQAEGLEVAPLSRLEMTRVLDGWAPLHWKSTQQVLDQARGLPGRLVRRVTEARLTPGPEGLELVDDPSEVRELMATWSPNACEAAGMLAQLGPSIDEDAVQQVAADLPWEGVVHELVRERILDVVPQGWVFRTDHARRELAPLAAGRSWSNRCSAALEAVGRYDQAVARALDAGLEERAVELFAQHCQDGRSVEAIQAFVDRLQGDLKERVHGRAQRVLTEAALRSRHADAEALWNEADRMARSLGWFHTMGHLAERSWNYRRTPLRPAIDAFEKAPETPERDWWLSSCWMHQAIEKPSSRAWEKALAYARSCGSLQRRSSTQAMHALKWHDDAQAAVAFQEVALANSGSVLQRVSAMMYLQHYLLKAEEWERVIEVGKEGIGWCELVANRQFLLFLLLNTAVAHARQTEWAAAGDFAAHALALPRHPPSTGIARLICAVHQAREGNPEAGLRLVPELADLFPLLFDTRDADLYWLLEELARALQPSDASRDVLRMITERSDA